MPRTVRSATSTAIVFVSALPIVVVFAYYVMPTRVADAHVLAWFSSYEHTAAGVAAEVITFFAEPVPMLFIVALACGYAIRRGRLADASAAVVVVAGANITTQGLKHLLAHDRFQAFLTNPPDLTTFPSGHVTGATSMVVALIWVAPPARRKAIALAGAVYVVLVGISVLVLEWHFPSDVLGALCVTGAWTFGVLAIYLYLLRRFPRFDRRARPRGDHQASRTALPVE